MSTPGGSPSRSLPFLPSPQWELLPCDDPAVVTNLQGELRLPRPLCKLLAARGFDDPATARRYLRPELEHLHPPEALTDADAAAQRLARAIRREETVLVHGDYDVDGMAAAALYVEWIRRLGGRAVPFIPHRTRDGYDLGPAGVQAAVEAGAGVVLTADCGIRAHEAVADAASRGIDVIVTDHHTPPEELPPARAVVNPRRPDCRYPCRDLSGAGVAWKLCLLMARAFGVVEERLLASLDLVALATVADVVPLVEENRVLVRLGLRVLEATRRPGLRALMAEADLDPAGVDAGSVGFVLAPRLNAAGRIGEPELGLRLLLASTEAEAMGVASRLEELNRTRREEERRTLDDALELLARDFDPDQDFGVVLAGEGWHPGVIGIVASRVAERIHRPTVMVALEGERGRGSARSVPGFDLLAAVSGCEPHLDRYGGHRQAAGMDLRRAAVPGFRQAFNDAARTALDGRPPRPRLRADLELPLGEAGGDFFRYLRYLGPFGPGNPRPVFLARGVSVEGPAREVGQGHLKLRLTDGASSLEAIGFRLAARIPAAEVNGKLDALFHLRENEYRGRRTIQARLLDLRANGDGGSG